MLIDVDAARCAVCPDCADGDPPVLSIDVWWHVNTGNICNANKLHGLPRIDPDALRIEGAAAMQKADIAEVNDRLEVARECDAGAEAMGTLRMVRLDLMTLDPATVVREVHHDA